MTNRRNGTLYVGVTDDLARRAWEHRAGVIEGFTKRYSLRRLVFAEFHENMLNARQRERTMNLNSAVDGWQNLRIGANAMA
jgi:putative endonuclease